MEEREYEVKRLGIQMIGPYYNNLQKINPYWMNMLRIPFWFSFVDAAEDDVVNDTTTARKMIIKLSDVLILDLLGNWNKQLLISNSSISCPFISLI